MEQIARWIASVPKDLLAIHKSISGKALDAMGRQLVHRLAVEADAMAHKTPIMKQLQGCVVLVPDRLWRFGWVNQRC